MPHAITNQIKHVARRFIIRIIWQKSSASKPTAVTVGSLCTAHTKLFPGNFPEIRFRPAAGNKQFLIFVSGTCWPTSGRISKSPLSFTDKDRSFTVHQCSYRRSVGHFIISSSISRETGLQQKSLEEAAD